MACQTLPASPNWYLSHISDGNSLGTYVFGARHDVFVFKILDNSVDFLGVFTGHRDRITAVALGQEFGQSEICCSTADDCLVKLWDVQTKAELQSHRDHKVKITAVSWSHVQTDLILTGDEKGYLVSWCFGQDNRSHFQFEKDYIYCLACCPHSASLLAIGYRSGVILLVDVGTIGLVQHRFHGHNDEVQSLAWCPVPGEDILFSDNKQNESDTVCGHLLASGSRDKTIRIWGTSKGKQLFKKKIPINQGYRRDAGEQTRGKVWTTVCWPKTKPQHLISSSVGGDILLWKLQADGEEKETFQVKDMKSHSRIVFNICFCGANDNTVMSISLDRTIMAWDFSSLTSKFYIPSLGGHVYNICVSPVDPGYVAVGVGDNTIRVWNTNNKNNKFDVNTIWQGLKSKVTALSWHPSKEGMIAFGTDDGRIGVFDVLTNRPPKSSVTFHRRTVYVVAWGPPSKESESQAAVSLYSNGDGKIFEHFPHAFSTEATNITKVIADVNEKVNTSGQTEIGWKPDNSAVAIGNEDGTVEIFQVSTFKLMCTINLHRKLVNTIVWHPQFTAQSPGGSPCQHWVASGACDSDIQIVDLTQLFDKDFNVDKPLTISHGVRKLEGHCIRVTDLSWNPHMDGQLVSVGYDSLAFVWDVRTGEAKKQYTGHFQRLLSVAWSGINPDVVFSGGFDSTLQCWNISTAPKAVLGTRNKKRKKKKQDTDITKDSSDVAGKNQTTEQVTASAKSVPAEENRNHLSLSPSQDTNEIQELQDLLNEKRQVLLEQQQQKSEQTTSVSGGTDEADTGKLNSAAACFSDLDGGEIDSAVTAETTQTDKGVVSIVYEAVDSIDDILQDHGADADATPRGKKQTGKFKDADARDSGGSLVTRSKKKKDRQKSVFPKSAKKENRGKSAVLEDLLWLTKTQLDEESTVKKTSSENFHLGFFSSRKQAYACLQEEGKHHLNHDNMEYYLQLEIWKGNIGGALQVARDREELSDWLVAMAPLASYDTWLAVCADYAHQLEEDGQYHKAATYLLACHKVYAAINLFKKHKLYKEAVALAKVRLSPLDPVLEDLYIDWSQQLLKDGNYEQAAKCYLAMKNVLDAAKLLGRRNDQPTLKTATHMTLLANEKQQGFHYAQKVVHQHISNNEWKDAYKFLNESETLKMLIPFVSMHELVMKEMEVLTSGVFQEVNSSCYTEWGDVPDGKAAIPDFILDVSDLDPVLPWKPFLKGKHSFPHHVLRIWYGCLDVAMDTDRLSMAYCTLSQLQSARQSHVDPMQLMAQMCMDLTLCLFALLLGETSSAITHLLHVVACLHNSGHFNLMQAVCQLMLPPGPKYLLKLQQEVTAMRVVISMESHRDVDGSAQPVKRYLSEIKDDGKISNTGLRCRELDCLRGYYYLAVLHCLQERCSSSSVSDLIPDSCEIPAAGKVCTNNDVDVSEAASCCKADHSDEVKAGVSRLTDDDDSVFSGKGKSDDSSVKIKSDDSSVKISNDCDVKMSEDHVVKNSDDSVVNKSNDCVVKKSNDVNSSDDSSVKMSSVIDKKSEDSVNNLEAKCLAKGDCVILSGSERTSGEASCLDTSSEPRSCLASPGRLSKSLDRVSDDCSKCDDSLQASTHSITCDGLAATCTQSSDKPKQLCPEQSLDKDVHLCQVGKKTTNVISTSAAAEESVTLPVLKHLAKGLLWDIQAKKCALTETLGYIHKAISKHLLADETKGIKTIASDRTTNPEQTGSTNTASAISRSSSVQNNKTSQNVPTGKVPNQTDDSVLQSHGNHFVKTVAAGSVSLPSRRWSENDVFPVRKNSSAVSLSEVEMIALASAEPSPKSRKVLWEDQPHVCNVMDYSMQEDTCLLSMVKYINVPDEWYGLPVDEKYFTSYVTMALLKEEQEYVVHELKRIPDCSQVPFPNCLDSAWQLLKLSLQVRSLSEDSKACFVHDVVLWALHFAMTRKQREDFHSLMKTEDGLQIENQHN